jgi:hypothetical protein
MADIGGARVILPDQAAVDDVVRKLTKNWRGSIERVRDYVATPRRRSKLCLSQRPGST